MLLSIFFDKCSPLVQDVYSQSYVDPAKRITVREALESEFVAEVRRPQMEVGIEQRDQYQ